MLCAGPVVRALVAKAAVLVLTVVTPTTVLVVTTVAVRGGIGDTPSTVKLTSPVRIEPSAAVTMAVKVTGEPKVLGLGAVVRLTVVSIAAVKVSVLFTEPPVRSLMVVM